MATPKEGWPAYNAKRKAYLQAYQRERHRRDPDKMIKRSREWYAANREVALARQRKHREANPLTDEQKEAKRITACARRAADPATAKDAKHRERARRRQCGAMPSRDKLAKMLVDARCAVCGSEDHPEIDHILPLALGGDHSPDNLQILCRPCNRSKGSKHPDEWRGRADRR